VNADIARPESFSHDFYRVPQNYAQCPIPRTITKQLSIVDDLACNTILQQIFHRLSGVSCSFSSLSKGALVPSYSGSIMISST